jgi:hypothetical protein
MEKSLKFVFEAFLLFSLMTLASCQKKLDKYYEVPGTVITPYFLMPLSVPVIKMSYAEKGL